MAGIKLHTDKTVINFDASMPRINTIRKNKNDFYRYLLSKNLDNLDAVKINNDLLIPRSILKRNNPGSLIKDKRLQEATEEYISYQQGQLKKTFEHIGKYDALFGQNIEPSNPVLNPKVKNVVDYIDRK